MLFKRFNLRVRTPKNLVLTKCIIAHLYNVLLLLTGKIASLVSQGRKLILSIYDLRLDKGDLFLLFFSFK